MNASDPQPAPAGRSALVLFSGGQDSTACLAWALSSFAKVETVGFYYGQRHGVEMAQRPRVREAIAAAFPDWGAKLGPDHDIDLRAFGALADSALTADREIEMQANGLPSTFVPGRNLVFLTYAGALAYRRGLDRLVGGMCETDYSGYPDCRRETIDAMEAALRLGLEAPIAIDTPLMRLTKAQTWGLTHQLGGEALVEITLEHSHTCYRGVRDARHAWGYGCGACPACALRAEGYGRWVAQRA